MYLSLKYVLIDFCQWFGISFCVCFFLLLLHLFALQQKIKMIQSHLSKVDSVPVLSGVVCAYAYCSFSRKDKPINWKLNEACRHFAEKMNISKWAPVSSEGKNAECQCSLLRILRATPQMCDCCVWWPLQLRLSSTAAPPQNRTELQGSRHFTARKGHVFRVSNLRLLRCAFSSFLIGGYLLQRPWSAFTWQQQRFDLKSVSFCCLSLCHSLVFIMSSFM